MSHENFTTFNCNYVYIKYFNHHFKFCVSKLFYYSTDDALLRKAFTDILNCCDIHFTYIYSCFIENDLMSSNQSSFKQGDSCINQILSITHDIYQSLDQGYEVRGAFLDISKAFHKVWHKGLIH